MMEPAHGHDRFGPSVAADGRSAEGAGQILAALQAWSPGPVRRFVDQGPWLVRRGLVGQVALGPLSRRRIPGLDGRRSLRLATRALTGGGVDLGVAADAMQLAAGGGRVRTFDQAAAASRKLVRRDTRYGVGTARELEVRRTILPGTGVGFPAVRNATADATHIFLEEDIVYGRRFHPNADVRWVRPGLVEPLTRLAAAQGARTLPLVDWLGPAAATAIAEDTRADPVLAHARTLVDRNPAVAVVFGHGDLVPSNIAVTARQLVLLDWESAGETLVGHDLLRLWLKYPGVDALLSGVAEMLARLEPGPLTLRDTVALRLAHVMAGTDRSVRPQARRRWLRLA